MFSQVITNAADLANQITLGPIPSDAQFVSQHVGAFNSTEIPAMRQLAADTTNFASNADATLTAMLTGLQGGATPASLVPQLTKLQAGIGALARQAASQNDSLTTTRDTFNADAANLQNQEVNLTAQAQGLQGKQRDLARQADKLQSEIDALNVVFWIPLFGPIIKGASELVHLIADHKSAEAALSDATNDLADVQQRIAILQGTAARTSQLQALIAQLGTGTQNLVNTITMIKGTLDNEDAFLNGVNDEPKLFLTAAQQSVRQLAVLVS